MTDGVTLEDRDDVVSDSSQPNYAAVEIPGETAPSEFHYTERRAELLEMIRNVGHPAALPPQRELAARYDVSQQQISKDLDRLSEHIAATMGDRRDLVTQSVYERSLRGLLNEDEYMDAVRAIESWNEWLDDRQSLRELEERLDRLERAEGPR